MSGVTLHNGSSCRHEFNGISQSPDIAFIVFLKVIAFIVTWVERKRNVNQIRKYPEVAV